MKAVLAAVLALAAAGCAFDRAANREPYQPTRRDYASFATAWSGLHEPNYLPFMVHRTPGDDARGDVLLLCRWADSAMPIPVHVTPVEIPAELQDEFSPRDPQRYEAAVRSALATWERELEGLVRFREVSRPAEARLTLQLVATRAPEPEADKKVLGAISFAEACRVGGIDPDAERLEVEFEVDELRLFLADEFGLLSPDQVEWIALHEVGHALGMRGHSPIAGDLMYAEARDRILLDEGLSEQDVNSFVSLYRLPNGSIFGRLGSLGDDQGPSDPGLPKLAMAPHVDARWGFELHPPSGWMRVRTSQGMVAVHGTTWDYTASFQVVVQRYATIQAFLDRYGPYYLARGLLSRPARLVVNGRPALQTEIERFDAPRIEQVTLVEVGDGRLLVIIADSSVETMDAYRPWFAATLATLEIVDQPDEGWPPDRRRR